MTFVCKQKGVLVVQPITLDNNNHVLTFSLCYTLPNTLGGFTDCISIVFSVLNILTDYAACWVPLDFLT